MVSVVYYRLVLDPFLTAVCRLILVANENHPLSFLCPLYATVIIESLNTEPPSCLDLDITVDLRDLAANCSSVRRLISD